MDILGNDEPMSSKATFQQISDDMLSKSRIYDVLYSDSLNEPPKFRWFMSDQKGAASFAKSCKHALIVVHSCRLAGIEDSHE